MTPLMKEMLTELAARRRPLRLFVIRKSGCYCGLADAYRLKAGDVLIGQRRTQVRTSRDRATAIVQPVVLPLDELDAEFLTGDLGCEHATTRITVPVEDVRMAINEAASGRRARSVPFLL